MKLKKYYCILTTHGQQYKDIGRGGGGGTL